MPGQSKGQDEGWNHSQALFIKCSLFVMQVLITKLIIKILSTISNYTDEPSLIRLHKLVITTFIIDIILLYVTVEFVLNGINITLIYYHFMFNS